ncbi:MAG: hypothetical protein KJO64_07300, partial [Bacteroidia bacterium]|nr:hypothetical protein [Bacteroidia bacterium]
MKKLLFLFSFLLISIGLNAQGMRNIGANIVIESGANMYIDGNSNGKYTNESTGGNHGEIDLDGSLYVEGDWLNNADAGNVFINNTSATWGTVHMNGSIAQNIGGSSATHFESLYLSNSTKTLTVDNVQVNSLMRLLSSDLDLNQNALIIDNNTPTSLTASAANGLISESNSANYGILQWNIGTATANDYVIPFIDGVGGTEIPLTFRPNSGTTGSIRVATYNTPANNTPFPPTVNHLQDATTGADNASIVADRFFMLDVAGAGVNADVTFYSTAAEASATTNPIAQRWIAANDHWEGPQGIQTNPTPSSTKAAGVTSFNTWWVLAPAANPLPVELLSWSAECYNSAVTLEWST